jgi:hypothetical protein
MVKLYRPVDKWIEKYADKFEMDEIKKRVKAVLDGHGVNGSERMEYWKFALQLLSPNVRSNREAIDGVMNHFILTYKLDSNICSELVKAVCGVEIGSKTEEVVEEEVREVTKEEKMPNWEEKRKIVKELEEELGIKRKEDSLNPLHV